LAEEYEIGYDMFSTIMSAREVQAKNLADFLVIKAQKHNLPIVIHGKAYKPDVPYCIGSYSTLIGHYVRLAGHNVFYVDPLADDQQDVVDTWDRAAVILLAHNREVTYSYADEQQEDVHYFNFMPGSIVVDPWRREKTLGSDIQVIHYGNTRDHQI
jgi:UDPglucose 6-dehydrogenase